jgi:hypothetical protein
MIERRPRAPAPRAGLTVDRLAGEGAKRFLRKREIDALHLEQPLILLHQCVLWLPVLQQILGRDLAEDFAGAAVFRRDYLGAEAVRARTAARRDDLLELQRLEPQEDIGIEQRARMNEKWQLNVCRLDHEGGCCDDHNWVRPLRNCSRSGGVSRLHALQLAFPDYTLVRLVHAFYPIFKLAAALGQLLCDFVRAAGDVATDCGGELYKLTDPKFVGQHGTLQRKARFNATGKTRIAVGFAKWRGAGEARAPDRRIRGSAGRACLDLRIGGISSQGRAT